MHTYLPIDILHSKYRILYSTNHQTKYSVIVINITNFLKQQLRNIK